MDMTSTIGFWPKLSCSTATTLKSPRPSLNLNDVSDDLYATRLAALREVLTTTPTGKFEVPSRFPRAPALTVFDRAHLVSWALGTEYFFHNSACQQTAFDDLREGQAVTFDVGQGPKGPRGENVRLS
jgi:hypothetical protein